MTQPLCYRGSEHTFEDDSAVADHDSEASSESEAGTKSHAESVTEELHSSVTSSRSSWSFGYHPLIAPPPSPASSVVSSSSDSALGPSVDTSSDGVNDDCSYIETGLRHEGLNETHFADQERDEAENDESFVDERSHPASFDGDHPSWASFGGDFSSFEDQEEKMSAVGRWVEDNP